MPANVIDVIRQMLADQRIDASTPQHGSSREADFVSSISWLDRPLVRSNGFIVSKRLTGRELLAIHAAAARWREPGCHVPHDSTTSAHQKVPLFNTNRRFEYRDIARVAVPPSLTRSD
jgi:hypothetical protein